MVALREGDVLLKNPTCIRLELRCRLNTAADWPVLIDLCLHLCRPDSTSIVVYPVENWVFDDFTAFLTRVIRRGNRWVAGLTDVHWVCRTVKACRIGSLVLLAGVIRQTELIGVLIDPFWIPAFTGTACSAVDSDLWGE
jgi:hypothetical protein